MRIKLEKIFFLYTLISIMISFFLSSIILKAIFAIPFFIILPYLMGNIFLENLGKIKKKIDFIGYFFISWSLGFLLIIGLAISLYSINLFNLFNLSVIIFGFYFVYYFYKFLKKEENFIEVSRNSLITFFILLILSFGVSLFVLRFNKFPLWVTWDFLYTHAHLANYVLNYSQIFRSFAYIDSISIFIALNSYLYNLDVFSLGWFYAHFLFPFLFLTGIFYFLNGFRIKREISFLISFCFLIILSTREIGSPFLVAPKSIIFISTPFIFGMINRYFKKEVCEKENREDIIKSFSVFGTIILLLFGIMSNKIFNLFSIGPIHYLIVSIIVFLILISTFFIKGNKKEYYFIIILIISILFFNHILMGLLVSVILLVYLFFIFLEDRFPKIGDILLVILFMTLFLLAFLQFFGILNIAKITNFLVHTNTNSVLYQTFNERIKDLVGIFTKKRVLDNSFGNVYINLFFWLFFFFGLLYYLIDSKREIRPLLGVLIVLTGISLFLLDIGVYRSFGILIVFMSLFIGKSIEVLYLFPTKKKSYLDYFKKITLIMVFSTIIMFSIIPSFSYMKWWENENGYYSTVEPSCYNAGNWMSKHLTKDTIIISPAKSSIDILTYYQLASISGLKIMPYIKPVGQSEEKKFMNRLVSSIFSQEDSLRTYSKIKDILNNEMYTKFYGPCVLGIKGICEKRFSKEWIERESRIDSAVIVIRKEDLRDVFFNENYFTLLYNNTEIYIFGVNENPGISFKIVE